MLKCRLSKCILFLAILSVVLVLLGNFLQPVWRDWNNYDTVQGFYDQPDNTIETIFLGASIVVNGVTPTELYRDYGICAYNLASEYQPLLASYYWLKEAYRLHSDTLDTVVLDASSLRASRELAFYQKAIDGMEMSSNKWEAVGAYTSSLQEQISYFFPLFEYHSRWTDLSESDFKKDRSSYKTFLRGYNYSSQQHIAIADESEEDLTVPEYTPDRDSGETELYAESLYYLQLTVDFCSAHGIKLVLMKTPGLTVWGSSDHNAVEQLAEEYGVDFLDFNYDPLFTEIEFNQATDVRDGGSHPNYRGATKLTNYLGSYLIDYCGNRDVRGNEKYSFLEEELSEYEAYIAEQQYYDEPNDAVEYLQAALADSDNIVFITVKDDAASSLTAEQRAAFQKLGLYELSNLEFRDSYIGIIDSGGVIKELHNRDLEKNTDALQSYDPEAAGSDSDDLYLDYKGNIGWNASYELQSGGIRLGNISSCVIDGTEYSSDERGLNFVVYSKSEDKVIDTRTFDTCSYSTQTDDIAKAYEEAISSGLSYSEMPEKVAELYLYNAECSAVKEAIDVRSNRTDDGFLYYLSHYMNRDNTVIYISAMDDAASQMNDESRQYLSDMGLEVLAGLQFRDSYIGIIKDGSVLAENSDHGEEPIEASGINYEVISGGGESGNCSSILIDDVEYSEGCRGLNIVVYDTELDKVIDTETFDTCAFPMTLPQNIVRSEVTE